MPIQAPFGFWESSISAEKVANGSIAQFDIVGDADYIYNVEMRPNENARFVIVRYLADDLSTREDVLPAGFSARTTVHEYGGRAFTVHQGTVYFVNFADQNLYKFKVGAQPQQLTKDSIRFAELNMTPQGLVAVAEQHFADGVEAKNYLVLINPETGDLKKIVEGYDFYAWPTVNADGTRIAWICWNHPNMPWDNTQLWVADLVNGEVKNPFQILSARTEVSFYQPIWTANNNLAFICDMNNWWNPYIWSSSNEAVFPLCNLPKDFATPLWNLGNSLWGLMGDQLVAFAQETKGLSSFGISSFRELSLYLINPTTKTIREEVSDFNAIDRVCIHNGKIYFLGARAASAPMLVRGQIDVMGKLNFLMTQAVYDNAKLGLHDNEISDATHIEFPTTSRQKIAYANFYAPRNPNYEAPAGTKPPVVVMCHGGPTGAAFPYLQILIQFWTSRGFAVVDVDYGGSTGYGREFRKALQRDDEKSPGYWGVIDVQDCVAAVKYLAEQGLIDPTKVMIRGRSAGGYTTLEALANYPEVFCAGTSIYGVTDTEAFITDTHKFESRYLMQLFGEWPKFAQVFKDRSPINHLERFKTPLLVLQGSEDKIVPPSQAEKLVQALEARGVHVEYKVYEGEQHGFRKAASIIDWLERESAFYRAVLQKQSLQAEAKKAPGSRPSSP